MFGVMTGVMQVELYFKIKAFTGIEGGLNLLTTSIVSELFWQPLHLIESRYILQNRIPMYKSFRNIWTMLYKARKELYNGALL